MNKQLSFLDEASEAQRVKKLTTVLQLSPLG